jgi:hypothetical protein
VIVVANHPGEHHDPARGRTGDGRQDLVYRQRGGAHVGQPYHAHQATVPARGSPGSARRGLRNRQDPRLPRRTWRTMAAVPITATVAPAAVMVASRFPSRRPATAW